MRLLFIITTVFLLLVGCARRSSRPIVVYDQDAAAILNEFLAYADYYNTPVDTTFLSIDVVNDGELSPKQEAICVRKVGMSLDPQFYHPVVMKNIKLKRAFWVKQPLIVQRSILFHELGHCILNQNHRDEMVDGHPVSLMNAGSWLEFNPARQKIGETLWDGWVYELFQNGFHATWRL